MILIAQGTAWLQKGRQYPVHTRASISRRHDSVIVGSVSPKRLKFVMLSNDHQRLMMVNDLLNFVRVWDYERQLRFSIPGVQAFQF